MGFSETDNISLCDLLDRVLNMGVVATGEIIISVAGVDLIYLNLQLLLSSVETAREGLPLQGLQTLAEPIQGIP